MRFTWSACLLPALTLSLACSNEAPPLEEGSSSAFPPGETSNNDSQSDPTGAEVPTTGSNEGTGDATTAMTQPPDETTSGTTTAVMGMTSSGTTTSETTATDGTESTSLGESSSGESSSGAPPDPTCSDGAQNQDETDVDCGGGLCGPCDAGEMCGDGPDCDSSLCENNLCLAAACDDGVQNQDESDADCGGATCLACVDGDSCVDDGDCESGVCTDMICQMPACDDGAQNQDETDIDCGGLVCDACFDGGGCVVDDDCLSQICEGDVCIAPTCFDAVQNGAELDVDCGGPDCAPCQLPGLILNEIDYDQPGADQAEFIEIYNNTGAVVSLVGLRLVLVNGGNNGTYANIDLSPGVALNQGQYLVVANNGVNVPPEAIKITINNDSVQNGAPDGVALVDTIAVQLLDALSYEGSITSANVTGLGMGINLVEGNAFPTADSANNPASLARIPNGNDKNDAATDWKLTSTPTPGAANVP